MKTLFVSTILVAFLTTHNAQASESGEQLGVAGVALASAAAGGPLGLIVGATLANHYVTQRSERADALQRASALDLELAAAQVQLASQQRSSADLADDLRQLQRENAQLADDRKLLSELQFDIRFRTADSALSTSDQVRLVRLAEFLSRHPELSVELHGHADARGPDALNDRLALERAHSVAAVLRGLDIDAARIAAFAYGERQATAGDSDVDGLAYDRRVRVALDSGESLTVESQSGADLAHAGDVGPGAVTATVAAADSAKLPVKLLLRISSRAESRSATPAASEPATMSVAD